MSLVPAYEYECPDCRTTQTVIRGIHDNPISDFKCLDCDVLYIRKWRLAGVMFKGSGFYSTDNK
jgi:predicted nucleic acid-binding Zn ribbon protein